MNLPRFNKPPGAVALDLDGTLLDSQSRLSERNRKAIEGCLARDIPVIIATARPARTLRRLISSDSVSSDLADRCSTVIMNGAVGRGAPPLSGSFKENLDPKLIGDIIKLVSGMLPIAQFTIELDGYEFGANWTADADTLWRRNAATADMVLSLEQAMARLPSKVAVGANWEGTSVAATQRSQTNLLQVADRIKEQFGESLSVVTADNATLLNITGAQATKPHAIKRLLECRGISLDEVIAFGDEGPDIGMLQECGTSVCVANAIPEVKAVASFVTASNDDDGVAIVLEEMLKAIRG